MQIFGNRTVSCSFAPRIRTNSLLPIHPNEWVLTLANICRSPLAEDIFSGLVDEAGRTSDFLIDSAGTGTWHVGNPPDPRSVDIAARHGLDISHQHARTVTEGDFDRFDVIIAMDGDNLAALASISKTPRAEVRLLLNAPPMDVPDPYFGGPEGFEDVFRLIRSGCEKLLSGIA